MDELAKTKKWLDSLECPFEMYIQIKDCSPKNHDIRIIPGTILRLIIRQLANAILGESTKYSYHFLTIEEHSRAPIIVRHDGFGNADGVLTWDGKSWMERL